MELLLPETTAVLMKPHAMERVHTAILMLEMGVV